MKKYLKKQKELFRESLRFDNRILFVVGFDALFYLFLYFGLTFWGKAITNLANGFKELGTGVTTQMMMDAAKMEQLVSQMKFFITKFVIITLILVVFIFLIWTLFRGLMWTKILKKKFTFGYWKKFSLLNLLWFLIVAIPIGFVFFIIVKIVSVQTGIGVFPTIPWVFSFVLFLLLFLAGHLTLNLYIFFTQKNKIKDSFKKMFKTGILKIRYFIIPYLVVLVIFIILLVITLIFNLLPQVIKLVITTIVLLFFIAWQRIYLASAVNAIK